MDDDIGWNDFALRNYDAQIGRWVQQDPYQEFASPYTGMSNDPINTIDPSGGIGIHCPGTSGLAIFLDNAVHAVSSFVISNASLLSGISIAVSIAKTGVFFAQAIEASNSLNGQLTTIQPGGDGPSSGTPRLRRANKEARKQYGESAKIDYNKNGQLTLSYIEEGGSILEPGGMGEVRIVVREISDGEKFLKGYSFWKKHKRQISTVLDLIPVVSTAKGIIEGVVGYNLEGDKLSTGDRVFGAVPLFKIKKAKKLLKFGDDAASLGKFAKKPPGNLTKLRGGQGWRDSDGNVWRKDMKHKDHWDVSNEKTGEKIKEVDFHGNQIWPDGPKNKNK